MTPLTKENVRERIFIALDYESLQAACACVESLPEALCFKVGLQAFLGFGAPLIHHLHAAGKKLFLDLKFKDIPNTVSGAVKSSLAYQPDFLTIHVTGGGEMIRQAVAAAGERPGLTVLGVTVLTSLSDQDLAETGMSGDTGAAVLRLVELGLNHGLNAFVCSPLEIEPIKKRFCREVRLVTPGIRPEWSARGDQKRVFTPRMALEAGGDYLVIGRPVTHDPEPPEAFRRIVAEMTA